MKPATLAKRRSSWMITLPLAAGAVAYLAWSFFPSMHALRELHAEIQSQRDFIAQAEKLTLAVQATERDLKAAQEYCAGWQARAPKGKQLADFFSRLLSLAQSSGTTNTRLEPQAPLDWESLAQIPVHLNVTGGYDETCELLRSLEEIPQAIWVSDLRIEANRGEGKRAMVQIKLDVFTGNREISN